MIILLKAVCVYMVAVPTAATAPTGAFGVPERNKVSVKQYVPESNDPVSQVKNDANGCFE